MFRTEISPLDPTVQEIVMAQILEIKEIEGFEQAEETLIIYHNDELSFDFLNETRQITITKEEIVPQNWNAVWEASFEPVVIGDFCTLRAKFHKIDANTQHDILITPKMSFGTGHHATTFQVIEATRNINFTNKTVCDYGTGTGILAILAEKLGAASIDAIDNDDWSIDNTKENIIANDSKKIAVIKDFTIDANKQYDIVLANINKNILLQHMTTISTVLPENGILVLSGILVADEMDLTHSIIFNNMKISNLTEKEGWLCIVCTKN